MQARPVDLIVVHCSATPNGRDLFERDATGKVIRTPVEVIDEWHKAAGFRRHQAQQARFNPQIRHCGYHFLLYVDGAIATGRAPDEVGAHARGYNARSIGICLLGTSRYTREQWASLAGLCGSLSQRLGRELVSDVDHRVPAAALERKRLRVLGHRDLSVDRDQDGAIQPREWSKTCPGFDAAQWFAAGMTPAPEQVL